MISWGISANSHDAALAVFKDNTLVFASHAERFSGLKNDRDLDRNLVVHAKQFGLPDQVYWYEQPFKKTLRQLFAGQGWRGRDNDIDIYMARYEINAPVTYVDHHLSHAAGGYYTSGFDNACVLVIDAIGEFETMTIWKAAGDRLEKVWSRSYPHSIGLFYSAMTQRIGLKPNEDEYITMGMAAYGKNKAYLHAMYNDFIKDPHEFKFKKNFHRGCQDWRPDLTITNSFEIAASTQLMYEHLFVNALAKAYALTKSKNLVLMGGCALNCLANRYTGEFFDATWIMPNPGDAGSAIGAVLANHPEWRFSQEEFTPFLGYNIKGTASNKEIVEYIIQNKICGVARGPAEFGPRALGNRSLLADPRGDDIKDRVNAIKQRQEFRPFAPAILEELVDMYFDMPCGWDRSRYMQVVACCKHPEIYPAIVHRDGTSRVQTVPDDGSPFRKLLELWYKETGCPMLLNTSLNIKGKPMVNDHADSKNFERHYGVKVFN
jgi:carbamoyltransferase